MGCRRERSQPYGLAFSPTCSTCVVVLLVANLRFSAREARSCSSTGQVPRALLQASVRALVATCSRGAGGAPIADGTNSLTRISRSAPHMLVVIRALRPSSSTSRVQSRVVVVSRVLASRTRCRPATSRRGSAADVGRARRRPVVAHDVPQRAGPTRAEVRPRGSCSARCATRPE